MNQLMGNEMKVFNEAQPFSTLIHVQKDGIDFFGNGFFAGKSGSNPQIFLFTNISLINDATSLKFLRYSEETEYQWIEFPTFSKNCRKSKFGIAKIDISQIVKDITSDCFPVEDVISDEEVDKFGLLKTLYIISSPFVKFPAYDGKVSVPIIEDCKNVNDLASAECGFYMVNLNHADWRVGAPVYANFGEKIKLVGMVGDWQTPEGLTSVIPARVVKTGIEE